MSLIYSTGSGMMLQSKRQETNALNLANTSTTGYKRDFIKSSSAFSQVLAEQTSHLNIKTRLGTSPGQVVTDWSQGILKQTERPLDFAISGDGFFEVSTPEGQRLFTRNGNFHLNARGQLVTAEGYTVSAETGNIQFTDNEISLNNLMITTDGYIRVNGSGTQADQTTEMGKLKIVSLADKDKLIRLSGNYFTLDAKDLKEMKQLEHYSKDGDGSVNYEVTNRYLECSNTSPIQEMTAMISNVRAYELNQKALKISQAAGRKAREVFG